MVEALVEQVAWLTPTSLFLLLNIVIATILVSSAFTNHHKKHPPQEPDHHHTGGADGYQYDYTTTTTRIAPPPPAAPLVRTPSLFSRVTSFNFNNYYPYNNTYHEEHQHQQGGLHGPSLSLLSRVASFNFSGRAGPECEVEEQGTKDLEPERAPELGRSYVRGYANQVVAPTPAPSLLSRVASFTLGRTPQVEVDDVDARRNSVVFNKKFTDNNDDVKDKKVKKKKKKGVVAKETTTLKRDEDGQEVEQVDAQADDFINRFKQQLKLQRIESLMRSRST